MSDGAQPDTRRRLLLAGLDDVEDGAAIRVDVDGKRIALVRVGDEVHAIGDQCSHSNVSLAEGEVDCDEMTIECWKHGSLFSICTGEAVTLPATQPVPVYDLEVVESEIFVVLK
jgi:3-phenylpropionate/trans-cinnamate dioxygenase ferredoxin component